MTRRFRFLAPLAVMMLVVAACDDGTGGSPGASGGGGATGACDPDEATNGTVSVLAVWATGDAEFESFQAMVEPFCTDTGIGIAYEGTRDANQVLSTRVQGGNPPDVAGLPGPGAMAQFANEGALTPLDDVLDLEAMAEEYGENWIELASVNDSVYGIFIKAAIKGPVWYSPSAFEEAGYTVPETFADLEALVEQIVADGNTPWCIGLGAEAATGWPATDWIEDILLRQAGPDVYRQWYTGELPWTDPAVQTAFETYGRWSTDEQYVKGGPDGAISTTFQNGGDGIFDASCYLHHQASFITGLGAFAEAEAGTDYDFFMFPEINHNAVIAAGDLFGMFNDTEQARQLLQYLTTAEAQQIWVERGGALSPNREVSLDAYPDDISRKSAEALINAEIVEFDASDLMPAEMIEGQGGFYETILNFMRSPDQLPQLLEEADATRESAFGG